MQKTFFTRSLNNRILVLLLAIGLLPLAILGSWTYQRTLNTLVEGRIERMAGLRDAKKKEIEQYFRERLGDLAILSVSEQAIQALSTPGTERNRYFSLWLEKYKALYRHHDISLVTSRGEVLYTTLGESLQGQNLARGLLAESGLGRAFAAASKGTVIQDFRPAEHQQALFMAAPVFQDEAWLGVVILQLTGQVIDELMEQTSGMGESGEIFLVGRDMAGSGLRSNRRSTQNRIGDPYNFAGLEAALAGNHEVVQRSDRFGIPVLTAYAPLAMPGVQWVIVLQFAMAEIEAPVQAWAMIYASFAGGLALVSVWLAWLLGKNLVTPLAALAQTAREIASGQWSARVTMAREDEIGQLAEAFNRMADTIESQNWLKSRANILRDLFGKAVTEENLCREVITALAQAIEAGQGAIYTRHDEDGRYHLMASFAYPKRKHLEHAFAPGEYLIGQCALENQTLIHTHVPSDYTEIGSGLGKAAPLNLILVPVAAGEQVMAIMELASFQAFTPSQIGLLENVAPSLGLALDKLRQSLRTVTLLKEVQRQAAELATQQEELLQANTTLEQQSRDLAASEEELRNQNQMLEESTRDLEQVNAELETKQATLQKVQADLTDKARELEIASRYKSEFLANMSHELRTPLNSILIIADNLLENSEANLSANQLTSARILRESGQDLLQLINGILDLAKIESGKMELRLQDVPLDGLLEEVRRSFLPVAEQKQLTFTIERQADLPATVRADATKVQQVLRNFLANAFKFTRQGGVTLRLFRCQASPGSCLASLPASREGYLAFAVHDTGIGVAPAKRSMIFEAFQQADGGISRQFGGTGLGLSISRALAELMQGTLCLDSTEGQGSTFTLLLPWTAPAVPAPLSLPAQDGKPLLVVIEDDPVFAAFVAKQAAGRGFAVYQATTGQQGLAAVHQGHPQGIILDLGLPDMDGWTLLATLQQDPRHQHIPVHVISGQEPPPDLQQTGAAGYLTKPVNREQLRQVLDHLIPSAGRVLVIDPDPAFHAQLQGVSQGLPVTLEWANNAMQAKACLQNNRYASIILDPAMPAGQEILLTLADQPRHGDTEVILCSSREMSREEHNRLLPFSHRILLKQGTDQTRLLDEITLFLHSLEKTRKDHPRRSPSLHGDEIFQNKQVLVVDDDMRNTFALTSALETRGMQVAMAPDGVTALDLLAKQPDTHLVLMDVMMPGMDGLETIRRIRDQETFRDLPIIALTAKAMQGDREKALAAGASDYLAKPVDLTRLFSMMRVWLYPRGNS